MHDVVIAGAGPVGLLLACELGLAGCSVVVLEREPEGPSPWRTAPLGMRGLTPASVEALHRRGLLDPLRAALGIETPDGGDGGDGDQAPPPRRAGHFAGIVLDPTRIHPSALTHRLPSPALDWMMVDLDAVETVLARRAAELGVRVRYDAPVTAVEQHGEGVVVRAGDQEHRGRWLVGCDGGRSVVRRLAGFEVEGTDPQFTGYVALVDPTDVAALPPMFTPTPRGMVLRMPAEGHIGIMDVDGGAFDRSRPVTREHLQAVLRRVSGLEVTLTDVRLASSFTDRAMQATAYRRGRVLLAGDAAHIHSPLGGQGLNTGLGDAVNLGWKLAATVHGTGPDGLLDTYHEERHPVAARVLDWSRAQVALMLPGPGTQALAAVVRDLLSTPDGTTYVFERTSGAAVRHDVGGEHPLAGRAAPEFRLADGTSLADLLAGGRGVVLDLGAGRGLEEVAARWPGRLVYAAGPARDDLGTGAVLVRPDGVVAWAGDPDPAALDRAARRWFGDPVPTTRATPARREFQEQA